MKLVTQDDIDTAINNGARMSEVEALIDEWAACAEAHQQWESEVRDGETRTFEQWYANDGGGQSQFEACGCEHTNGTVYLCLAHQPEDQGTTPVWGDLG
jgi:hypothetical protein